MEPAPAGAASLSLPAPEHAAIWLFDEPVPYDDAVRLMEALVAEVAAGRCGPVMLVLEHPPVVTLGRGADAAVAAAATAPVVRTARGGSVTVHGPGQVIAYPVVDLRAAGWSVHGFVRMLEDWMLATAAQDGAIAERREGLTGIWTTRGKLGSIGIAVRRGVTWHGLALYVEDQTSAFGNLHPCALPGVRPDCLRNWTPEASRTRTAARLAECFAAALPDRRCPTQPQTLAAVRQWLSELEAAA